MREGEDAAGGRAGDEVEVIHQVGVEIPLELREDVSREERLGPASVPGKHLKRARSACTSSLMWPHCVHPDTCLRHPLRDSPVRAEAK